MTQSRSTAIDPLRVAAWVLGTTLLFGICWLLAGASGARPGYDASWHLIWARDLLNGVKPQLNGWAAPTEHPLMLTIAALCALFGGSAPQALIAAELVALDLTLMVAIRLMRATTGSVASGVVGWLLLAGGYGLLLAALRGYLDVWFVLLIVWGAALQAERRDPAAGWVAFGLAGLLRPEAWLLSILSGTVAWRRGDRAGALRLVAAAALAAITWFGFDALITGKPLLSFETARTLALEGDGGGALRVLAVSLFGGIRGPITLLGLLGGGLAIRRLGSHRVWPLVAIGATGLGSATAISVLGLTLLPRYLMLAWLALAMFGGYCIAGWTGQRARTPARRRQMIFGSAVGVVGVVLAVALGTPSKLASEVRIDRAIDNDLSSLLSNPRVKAGLQCGPLTFPSFRLVPDAILTLDDSSISVRARGRIPKPTAGVAVVVSSTDEAYLGRYSHPGIALPVDEAVPPGFRAEASTPTLTAYVRCA